MSSKFFLTILPMLVLLPLSAGQGVEDIPKDVPSDLPVRRQAPVKKTTGKVKTKVVQRGKTGPSQLDPKKSDPKGKGKPTKDVAKGAGKTGEEAAKKNKKNKKGTGEVELNIETKDASENSEIPIPEGATEEDIRVIRNANKMLIAEKRLGAIMKRLKVKGNAMVLPFDKLDSWIYEDGFEGMPKELEKLNGKRVVMAGFMFPIYEVENIKTFYLVKSLWSCCYGQPPDINGLVRVTVKKKGGIAYQYDPIFVVGTLRLKKTMDEDYCTDIYTIESDSVKVLDLDIK